MPIVIATCTDCGHAIEIDTAYAVVLSGTPETVWRIVKANYRIGERIDTQMIADLAFTSRMTIYRALRHLARYGLITPTRIKTRNHYYAIARKHPTKITRAVGKTA